MWKVSRIALALFHSSETNLGVTETPVLMKRMREHLKECENASSMEWHKNYGRSLAYLRDKKGMTLRVVSEGCGISPATLWRLENGKARWTELSAESYLKTLE